MTHGPQSRGRSGRRSTVLLHERRVLKGGRGPLKGFGSVPLVPETGSRTGVESGPVVPEHLVEEVTEERESPVD